MGRVYSIIIALFLAAGLPVIAYAAGDESPKAADAAVKHDSLSIKTADGKTHNFSIEVADTEELRQKGLQDRKELPANQGMLFVFEEDTYVEMWMKGALIPLDMLFLDNKGKVIFIAENAKPGSTDIISAKRDARAVLELAGGTVAKLGIKSGDQVVSSYFK